MKAVSKHTCNGKSVYLTCQGGLCTNVDQKVVHTDPKVTPRSREERKQQAREKNGSKPCTVEEIGFKNQSSQVSKKNKHIIKQTGSQTLPKEEGINIELPYYLKHTDFYKKIMKHVKKQESVIYTQDKRAHNRK